MGQATELHTAGFAARHRMEAWRESAFRFMDAAPLGPALQFNGHAIWRAAGGMEFWRYRSSAVAVRRDHARCRKDGADALVIMAMRRGSATLQHREEATIRASDVFLCDAATPLVGRWNAHEEVHVTLPRAMLGFRLGRLERHWAGRHFKACHPVGALLSAYLRQLGEHLSVLDDGGLELAGLHIADLAVRAIRAGDEQPVHGPAPAAAVVSRLLDCIEVRLADPLLASPGLAAELGWSLRKLYRVAEALPDGIAGTIARRRLERIHADLRDPTLAHLRIGDIAGAWCFSDMSHFSRAFRRQFGCAPSAVRSESGTRPRHVTSG